MSFDDDDRPDERPIFDAALVRNYLRYATGSVHRRKRMIALIVTLVVGLTAFALWSMPKTYHVEAKVLAQTNAALSVREGASGDAPTRSAAETILRRDKLVELVRRLDLVRHYRDHRAPLTRARDAVFGLAGGPPETEQDRIDGMVDLLEKRLAVWTNEGGATVSIAIDWLDADMARRIVEAAQQDYLESRYAQEITALGESLAILQSHAASSRADVDAAVAALGEIVEASPANAPPSETKATPRAAPVHVAVVAPSTPAVPSEEQKQIRISIEAKQRALDDLEEFRKRRLTDLQTRLAEQRSIYTENHPVVVDLRGQIADLSSESPQVLSLRSEIAELRTEEGRFGDATADAQVPIARSLPTADKTAPELPSDIVRLGVDLREDRDPNVMYARAQVRDAMDKYGALRSHIQATEIDLETAKAGFKYRYAVVTPPHLPKKPVKPNAPLVMLASILAALFAAVSLAILADLREGRLVESWELERLLGGPVIIDLEVPRLPRAGTQ